MLELRDKLTRFNLTARREKLVTTIFSTTLQRSRRNVGCVIRQPPYSFHKATGQARVTINRRDIYLGPHNSPESLDRYSDVIAEWRIHNAPDRFTLTIDDLALSYLEHAKKHYRKDGRETSGGCCVRNALRFVIAVAGRTRARDFGPKLLKDARQRMIDAGWRARRSTTMLGASV